MDVVVELIGSKPRRTVRYNDVSSWRIISTFVNALFAPEGRWHGVYYHTFRMHRVDRPKTSETDTD